ncbi:MAG TPA: NAD-dependent epimerase/dehydratase family protein [Anaerolineae bacterium]|nr:NAD-dependent epimerase/dehydratase family protein [Anaerolineae bacterium]
MMKVLVTGAGGKTGKHVIDALLARGAQVRAWVRTPRHATGLPSGVETYSGDLLEAARWPEALAGVDAVYHIAPNMFPREFELGKLAIDGASRAGVERFIFHSVLHPQTEAMPHHWWKLRVEEDLFTSGLTFTILQPTAYMQNLLAQWPAIRDEGVLRQPYAPEARISLVDLRDVAEVAAIALLEPGHESATYELAGTPPLSQHETAAILARALDRPVQAEAISRETWAQRATGLSDYARTTLLKMFEYYEHHGLAGNPNVLRWLLGREPRSLAAWARSLLGK